MRGGSIADALNPFGCRCPIAQIRKTRPETVAAVDRLLETHGDEATARELNAKGHRNWKGDPYAAAHVGRIRRAYGLAQRTLERETKRLRERGLSRPPRKWPSSSASTRGSSGGWAKRQRTRGWSGSSFRLTAADGIACTGRGGAGEAPPLAEARIRETENGRIERHRRRQTGPSRRFGAASKSSAK